MSIKTQRTLMHLAAFAVILAMMLTHDSAVSINSRLMMIVVAGLSGVVVLITVVRKRSLRLVSPLDFGWLPFFLITGASVLFALFPRRSLESWEWTTAIQIPAVYGTICLVRSRWPERALYRGLLGTGAYLYGIGLLAFAAYVGTALAQGTSGLSLSGFRLFDVMNHPNIFGMFIAISTACMVGYVFLPMKRPERFAIIIWLGGALINLISTASRTSLIATLVGSAAALILALVAHPKRPLNRLRIWAGAYRRQAVGIGILGGLVGLTALGILIYLQFGRPLQDSGGGRLGYWRTALDIISTHPILGSGPASFVLGEVRTHSVPPYVPFPHAHDMFLNITAESGLLGLLGFLTLFAIAVWCCVAAWRQGPERRPMLAGAIGGLIAFTLTGITDTPTNEFGPFFLAAVLTGFIAAGLPIPERVSRWRIGMILVSVIAIVVMGVGLVIPYSTIWRVMQVDSAKRAISADPASWKSAAQELDSVSAVDNGDGLVILQTAYLWSTVYYNADGKDSNALQNAIQRFEQGIPYDPYLGLHSLNLSVLYLAAGRSADAVRAAERAAQQASADPVTWLNLGIAREASGDLSGAQEVYFKALDLEPEWASVGFWKSSPTRATARSAYLPKLPATTTRLSEMIRRGDIQRQAGKSADAAALYQQALGLASTPTSQAFVRGMIAWADGDLSAARASLTQATISPLDIQAIYADAWLYLGDLARDQGDTQGMIENYANAYQYYTTRGLQGFGARGNYQYAIISFQRYGVITDYLPGVVILDILPERAERFKVLAKAVEQGGNPAAALNIYRTILQSDPTDAEANAALGRLQP